jgi:hypothetical protein
MVEVVGRRHGLGEKEEAAIRTFRIAAPNLRAPRPRGAPMPRVTDQSAAVKRPAAAGGLPRPVVEQKALEVAAFVRARMRRTAPGQDHDDVYQEAVLWALEWAERYGEKFVGDNPFTKMSAVAFRRARRMVNRSKYQQSVSEHVADRRGKAAEGVATGALPIVGCGYGDGIEEGGAVAVQVGGQTPGVAPLSGEDDRRSAAAQVLGALRPDERRLVRGVAGGDRLLDSKVSRGRARRALRRFAAAVGPDPSILPIRLAARDPRLPPPNTVLEVEHGDRPRVVRLVVGVETFTYAGETCGSISAAAERAARDVGLCTKAQNGYEFWGLGRRRRLAA